jgi:hypothetical protein
MKRKHEEIKPALKQYISTLNRHFVDISGISHIILKYLFAQDPRVFCDVWPKGRCLLGIDSFKKLHHELRSHFDLKRYQMLREERDHYMLEPPVFSESLRDCRKMFSVNAVSPLHLMVAGACGKRDKYRALLVCGFLAFWRALETEEKLSPKECFRQLALFCVIAGRHRAVSQRLLFHALIAMSLIQSYEEFRRHAEATKYIISTPREMEKRVCLLFARLSELEKVPIASLFVTSRKSCMESTEWREKFKALFVDGESDDDAVWRLLKQERIGEIYHSNRSLGYFLQKQKKPQICSGRAQMIEAVEAACVLTNRII